MDKRLKSLGWASGFAVSLLLAPVAGLAESGDQVQRGGWVFTLGAGAGIAPDYEGSDDYEPVPIPFARAQMDHYYAQLEGTSLKVNVMPSKYINFGPLFTYRFGRDDVDSRRVDNLPDVDESFELGGFVRIDYRNWNISLEGTHDVSGAHDGFLFTFGGGHTFDLSESLSWDLGINATYASEDYMDEYFSVTASGAAQSGLRQFNAGDGIKNFGASSSLNYRISETWGASLLFSYSRLTEDAEDSPVTDDEGSADQFFGGLIGTYTF